MKTDNKRVYESSELARQYGAADTLQPPEQAIVDAIEHRLTGARMLDVGVGGGRTTVHFASLVESYVGIDYSEPMIAICRERFREMPGRLSFQVADARSLSMFPNESFDFVLFSYNGLDYIPHESRPDALREIRRVLKKGGHFALSTHNLNSLRKRLRPRLRLNPRVSASSLLWTCRFLWHNGKLFNIGKMGHCEVYDGALAYRLRTHYISPECAVDELARLGFREVRIFGLATGHQILGEEQLRSNTDDWLYYLSTV